MGKTSLATRLEIAAAKIDSGNRYCDFACQLQEKIKGDDGNLVDGRTSDIIGGVLDTWEMQYVSKDVRQVLSLAVSPAQYDYCLSRKPRITAAGGRGGGKTGALATRAICKIVECVGQPGMVVSPDYDHTQIVWDFILSIVPRTWLIAGVRGISLSRRILRFVNGVEVRFRSADREDSLRGWDAAWAALDEEKDIPDRAIDIMWGCLRITETPSVFGAGTPEMGEYHERYKRMIDDDDSEVFTLPSRDNPFIPSAVFDLMETQMDERRYKQEVLAEFVPQEDIALVVPGFSRDLHVVTAHQIRGWQDITYEYTSERLGIGRGYIGGVDYNFDAPNFCVLHKVYRQKPNGPICWVAHRVVTCKGNAGHMAVELKRLGYQGAAPHYPAPNPRTRRDVVIVDDASGRYNRGPKSSSRLMRQGGFTVRQKAKNPLQVDRVNAFNALVQPAQGPIRYFVAATECDQLLESCEWLMWGPTGEKIDKKSGHDHVFDAASYPVAYCMPAAVIGTAWFPSE